MTADATLARLAEKWEQEVRHIRRDAIGEFPDGAERRVGLAVAEAVRACSAELRAALSAHQGPSPRVILGALLSYRSHQWRDADGDGMALLDLLRPDTPSVEPHKREMERLADHIAGEVWARSVQSVPSGGEEGSVESSRFLAPVVASPQTASAVDSAKSATDSPHHHPVQSVPSGPSPEDVLPTKEQLAQDEAFHEAIAAHDLRLLIEQLEDASRKVDARVGDDGEVPGDDERLLMHLGSLAWEAAEALRMRSAGSGSVPSGPPEPFLELLETAAKALRDVSLYTKGGGPLMRELLADCNRIAKKCELAVWSYYAAKREGDLEVGAGSPLPPEPREEVQG